VIEGGLQDRLRASVLETNMSEAINIEIGPTQRCAVQYHLCDRCRVERDVSDQVKLRMFHMAARNIERGIALRNGSLVPNLKSWLALNVPPCPHSLAVRDDISPLLVHQGDVKNEVAV